MRGRQPAGAAATEPGLADAVDRPLRARRRAGFARRKRFCHARIGHRIIGTSTKQRGEMPGWTARMGASVATGGLGCASRWSVRFWRPRRRKGKLRAELERLAEPGVGSSVRRRGRCASRPPRSSAGTTRRGRRTTTRWARSSAARAPMPGRQRAMSAALIEGAARSIPGASVVVGTAPPREPGGAGRDRSRARPDAVLRDADAGDAGSRAGAQAPAQVA